MVWGFHSESSEVKHVIIMFSDQYESIMLKESALSHALKKYGNENSGLWSTFLSVLYLKLTHWMAIFVSEPLFSHTG